MCYRTKLNAKISEIERAFEAAFAEPELYVPTEEINAFDFLKTPVIIDAAPGEILFYQWGLIPFWAKNDQIKKSTLNAKIETAAEKPAFRDSVENRCLIVANGYYEWQWLDSKGKNKQKFLIEPVDQDVFAFAGIYSIWKDPSVNEEIGTYSILTTEANELMSEIHNMKKRMPVLLHKKDHKSWLHGNNIESFAFPYEVNLQATSLEGQASLF